MNTNLFDVRGSEEAGTEGSSADPILVLILAAGGRGLTRCVEGRFPIGNEAFHDGESIPFQALFDFLCTYCMCILYVHFVCPYVKTCECVKRMYDVHIIYAYKNSPPIHIICTYGKWIRREF